LETGNLKLETRNGKITGKLLENESKITGNKKPENGK
jgi:hypothetical protein